MDFPLSERDEMGEGWKLSKGNRGALKKALEAGGAPGGDAIDHAI